MRRSVIDSPCLLRGARVFDSATGESTRRDIGVTQGIIRDPQELSDVREIDASGLHIMFGLWDCHAHPGGLMYDASAQGYFEGAAEWAVRAGANLMEAARMGVTGVRAVAEADRVDLSWARAFAAGVLLGPRLVCSGAGIRTTGGHGTAFPRRPVEVEWEITADGATEMRRAVRSLIEQGVDWIKVMLTGGLYSAYEAVDDSQLSEDEFNAVMDTARQRGVPVAAHCGSGRIAEKFAAAGGRSVEHGYALDERAAQAMAMAGTWLVPTVGVTHDEKMMLENAWPEHALARAREAAAQHRDALGACLEAGVRVATGADLNPIGPRLRVELQLLEKVGMTRQQILHSATVGGRALNGLGEETTPLPGVAADLIFVEGDPMDQLNVVFEPRAVMTFGRFVVPL